MLIALASSEEAQHFFFVGREPRAAPDGGALPRDALVLASQDDAHATWPIRRVMWYSQPNPATDQRVQDCQVWAPARMVRMCSTRGLDEAAGGRVPVSATA